jgi:hypothetical protein
LDAWCDTLRICADRSVTATSTLVAFVIGMVGAMFTVTSLCLGALTLTS